MGAFEDLVYARQTIITGLRARFAASTAHGGWCLTRPEQIGDVVEVNCHGALADRGSATRADSPHDVLRNDPAQ